MADEPESLTIRLLQELRAEIREFRADTDQRFEDLRQRVDGNTLLLNLVAGVTHDQEHRITALEPGKA